MLAQASTAIVNATGDVANVLVESITSRPLLKVKHDLKENIKKFVDCDRKIVIFIDYELE